MTKDKWVIFDLDGTLADIETRRKMATKSNGKMDWDVFFADKLVELDDPNQPVIDTCKALKQHWLDDLFPIDSKRLDIVCVFDDRDKVVDMWRKNGLTCMQVAPGNF